MSFINFTTVSNGILFDLTALGTDTIKVFRPSVSHTITRVSYTNSVMSYQVTDGTDYNFSFDGTTGTQLKINGVVCSDNEDLFNQFIALL